MADDRELLRLYEEADMDGVVIARHKSGVAKHRAKVDVRREVLQRVMRLVPDPVTATRTQMRMCLLAMKCVEDALTLYIEALNTLVSVQDRIIAARQALIDEMYAEQERMTDVSCEQKVDLTRGDPVTSSKVLWALERKAMLSTPVSRHCGAQAWI